jgi:hypothetical protein
VTEPTSYEPPHSLDAGVAARMEYLALRMFHEHLHDQIIVCTHVDGKLWGVQAVDRDRYEWRELDR